MLICLSVIFDVADAAWITALVPSEGRNTSLFAGPFFFAMISPRLGSEVVKRLGWKAAPPAALRPFRERIVAAEQGIGILDAVLWTT